MGSVLSVAAATGTQDGVSQTGVEGPTVVEGGAAPAQAAVKPLNIAEKPAAKQVTKWPPGICDWMNDGSGDWEIDVAGPQRLKQSILTPEETKKCQEIIAQVFHRDTVVGARIAFEPDDVMWVMTKVKEYLKHEPMLIEDLSFPIQIVGDLHGQLYDLARIFEADAKDGKPAWECTKYIFLGNYVDRGRQSIEIIMALFCIKMLHPDRVFLLRGRHEFIAVNYNGSFIEEFLLRHPKEIAEVLYFTVNETFGWLSIAAIVGNVYFCAHGGISPSGFTRRQFRGIYKPKFEPNEDIMVKNVCFSEPADGLRGSCYSAKGDSLFYGLDSVAHALASMKLKFIIRAGNVSKGYVITWNVCATLFSATDFQSKANLGATAVINEEGKIAFKVFNVDKTRSALEASVRRTERPWLFNEVKEKREKKNKKKKAKIGNPKDNVDAGTRRF